MLETMHIYTKKLFNNIEMEGGDKYETFTENVRFRKGGY